MKRFIALYDRLESATSTQEKVAALVEYFKAEPPEDAAWAMAFVSGRMRKRLVPGAALAGWAVAEAGVPAWLFDESHGVVGDMAETISLLLGREHSVDRPWPVEVPLSAWMHEHLLPLREMDLASQREHVVGWWRDLNRRSIFVLCKILTGTVRLGVPMPVVTRALAEIAGVPTAVIAHRLMGDWSTSAEFFRRVVSPDASASRGATPYPFCLGVAYEGTVADMALSLGDIEDWQMEWKYDGVRVQIIKRDGRAFVWSRGEEMIADKFPEVADAASKLPDGTVLDGELVIRTDGKILPHAVLQARLKQTRVSKALIAKMPAAVMAYDVLEESGLDRRVTPLAVRRRILERIVAGFEPRICLTPIIPALSWREAAGARAQSRSRGVEGLMLKRLDSLYGSGREQPDARGGWWKWKVGPHTLDAVLVMAQHGEGKRANVFADYTFAAWEQGRLVPIARVRNGDAAAGLTKAEVEELDRWIRSHSLSRFGPVRAVEPVMVFELGFEGVTPSSRHQTGLALRSPKILRWRRDKPAHEADVLGRLQRMVDSVRALGASEEMDDTRNVPGLFDETKTE
jgi:DNA ligase 1